ncbi:MAG: response regulator [Phenylobacterium sp.]|uniref:response regulator transcription factor n=1 Tax=Phenylobacterium sp. TaxID=1871053 RepID=UPI0025DBDC8E|nr:response regulator [Phenylobacterium sp.]MCA6235173.1 response regulator [Phenylobacterium sp.]MCA6248809.1 response regulator [Phenylobacterium sp.]MCA6258500.1 response regulator [Phenylobacterium sp.]MCA6266241.1 response regulator [Phenylobacterium sp.]MCA6273483.1 response regulator [Phenylobacterium sp.]
MPATSALPPTLMLVDDDLALRSALKFALELDGYKVRTFASGEALLEADLPARNVCLVVDENLPGIGGLDSVGALRARSQDLPALLITSHPGPELRRRAGRMRVPIIEKPLIDDLLIRNIRWALGQTPWA